MRCARQGPQASSGTWHKVPEVPSDGGAMHGEARQLAVVRRGGDFEHRLGRHPGLLLAR